MEGGNDFCSSPILKARTNEFTVHGWPWTDGDKDSTWRRLYPERCESFGCRCNFKATLKAPSSQFPRRLCAIVEYYIVRMRTTPNLCVSTCAEENWTYYNLLISHGDIPETKDLASCIVCWRPDRVRCEVTWKDYDPRYSTLPWLTEHRAVLEDVISKKQT